MDHTQSQPGAHDDLSSRKPERVGPYRILGELGEGGFGVVYEAEQTTPMVRRVALKLIKPGMDSKAVISRFEAERQALAVMDHPCIAKVYDGGVTEMGLPYFAMELVRGLPITTHCDTQMLSITDRIELFIHVCDAVQHAHSKGVIHRDLKPSNILVAYQGDEQIPKVIDFGIAKALGQKLSEATIFTQQGQLIGTPEYMSPEQAEMGAQDIDTRSDVYSLGVILYELLTGVRPFDGQDFREGAKGDIQRLIRETEPPRPSTKLSWVLSTSRGSMIASQRRTELKSLSQTLRQDLDWVVMKCLEKDRSRRYETANAIAMELQRYLSNEPVLAGPPSVRYKLGKFVKRNRVLIGAGVITGTAVMGSLAMATYGFVHASGERDAAIEARDEAENTVGFLVEILGSPDPTQRGRDVTVREVLGWASLNVDKRFASRPLSEARVRSAIGGAYRSLGNYREALEHLPKVYEIRKAQLGENHPDTLRAMGNYAGLLQQMDHDDQAEVMLRDLLRRSTAALGGDHPTTLAAMNNLSQLLWSLSRREEALQIQRRAVELYKVALGPTHADTLGVTGNLARMEAENGNLDEARLLHEEVLGAWRRSHGEDAPGSMMAAHNLGLFYLDTGRYEMAENVYRGVLERRARVLGEEHPDTLGTKINLGIVRCRQGQYGEGVSLLLGAFNRSRSVLGDAHESTSIAADELLSAYEAQGWPANAESAIERVVAYLQASTDRADPSARRLNALAWTLLTVEPVRLRDARAAMKLSMRACERARNEQSPDLWEYLDTLALAMHEAGDHTGAVRTQREAIELTPPRGAPYRDEMRERLEQYEAALTGGP